MRPAARKRLSQSVRQYECPRCGKHYPYETHHDLDEVTVHRLQHLAADSHGCFWGMTRWALDRDGPRRVLSGRYPLS